MPTFSVIDEITFQRIFEVDADSEDEALDKVSGGDGELVSEEQIDNTPYEICED